MALQKVITRDGSPTLYSERFHQHYHNVFGALIESRHVFFDRTGVINALSKHCDFTIFEVGFGTGFHVLLLEQLRKETASQSYVRFYSVDKYPPENRIIREMKYSGLFPELGSITDILASFSNRLHNLQPNHSIEADLTRTHIQVFHGDFFDWDAKSISLPVHFFLHDPFSPKSNPELWSCKTFNKLFNIADKQAILGTYCSATKARAAMVLSGWHVFRAPGPPGKREMTLAAPDKTILREYKQVNEEKLKERFQNKL